MGKDTHIEWCDHTFSPWRGCTKISPGCTNCYAEALSHRNPAVLGEWGDKGTRIPAAPSAWRQLLTWDRAAKRAGERRRVFPSLCDPFEDRDELVGRLAFFLEYTQDTPNLDYLLLTKRPQNWRPILERIVETCGSREAISRPPQIVADWLAGSPPKNIWLGVSVEDQARADERIHHLQAIPAVVRYLSVEPLLSAVDLTPWLGFHHEDDFDGAVENPDQSLPREQGVPFHDPWVHGPDWVIVGSESGPHARPMDENWVRSLRDQCQAAGVPFFYKQRLEGRRVVSLPELDGRTWAEFPTPTPTPTVNLEA